MGFVRLRGDYKKSRHMKADQTDRAHHLYGYDRQDKVSPIATVLGPNLVMTSIRALVVASVVNDAVFVQSSSQTAQ